MTAPTTDECAARLLDCRSSLAAITFDDLPSATRDAAGAALAALDRLVEVSAALTAVRTQPTISVDQYADLAGVNRITMYSHVKAGEVPTLRIGRRIRVPSAFVLRQLRIEAAA